ncbi:hypothetical protein DV736_g6078, partial [Chaetothyriales sp. CBS 134916]
MSANGSAVPEQTSEIVDKGKGKAVEQPAHDLDMDNDDDDEEESGPEEPQEGEDDDEEEDMEEIDPSNIISNYGQRSSRKKEIDWAEAAEKSKAADLDTTGTPESSELDSQHGFFRAMASGLTRLQEQAIAFHESKVP